MKKVLINIFVFTAVVGNGQLHASSLSQCFSSFYNTFNYTQEEKDNAKIAVTQLKQQLALVTKTYQTAIDQSTNPQEWAQLKQGLTLATQEISAKIREQQIISGEVMSTNKKLFYGVVAAVSTVAAGYYGYARFMTAPKEKKSAESAKKPAPAAKESSKKTSSTENTEKKPTKPNPTVNKTNSTAKKPAPAAKKTSSRKNDIKAQNKGIGHQLKEMGSSLGQAASQFSQDARVAGQDLFDIVTVSEMTAEDKSKYREEKDQKLAVESDQNREYIMKEGWKLGNQGLEWSKEIGTKGLEKGKELSNQLYDWMFENDTPEDKKP